MEVYTDSNRVESVIVLVDFYMKFRVVHQP
jgi:hypothetical protein